MPQGTTVNPELDILVDDPTELDERLEAPPPSVPEPPSGDDGMVVTINLNR